MADFNMLERVKINLGQASNPYVDGLFQGYIDEVREYLQDAGVPEEVTATKPFAGIITRGVADLWDYGSGKGTLSPYFHERATQLICKWNARKREGKLNEQA